MKVEIYTRLISYLFLFARMHFLQDLRFICCLIADYCFYKGLREGFFKFIKKYFNTKKSSISVKIKIKFRQNTTLKSKSNKMFENLKYWLFGRPEPTTDEEKPGKLKPRSKVLKAECEKNWGHPIEPAQKKAKQSLTKKAATMDKPKGRKNPVARSGRAKNAAAALRKAARELEKAEEHPEVAKINWTRTVKNLTKKSKKSGKATKKTTVKKLKKGENSENSQKLEKDENFEDSQKFEAEQRSKRQRTRPRYLSDCDV
jgi:hypothetical protein